MKPAWLAFLVVGMIITASCTRQETKPDPTPAKPATRSSFDAPRPGDAPKPALTVKFEQADLAQVMKLYAELSGRSVIWATNLPEAKITFANQQPMTAIEILQALDTSLAAQEITTIYMGAQYVKVVPTKNAAVETAPLVDLKPEQLPDSSSFLMYVVKPRHIKASRGAMALQSFARIPNAVLAIDKQPIPASAKKALPFIPDSLLSGKGENVLVLRDYSSNVKRMLKVLEQIDVP